MVRGLTGLVRDQEIFAPHFTGIGALRAAILGYFDVTRREYRRFGIDEQVECSPHGEYSPQLRRTFDPVSGLSPGGRADEVICYSADIITSLRERWWCRKRSPTITTAATRFAPRIDHGSMVWSSHEAST